MTKKLTFILFILISGCLSQKPDFEKKALELEVGEEKMYVFYMKQENIGYNKYKVISKTDEGYRIKSETMLNVEGLDLKIKSEYVITSYCKPLSYSFNALVNGEEQRLEVVFEDNTAKEKIFVGGKTTQKTVSLKENTYLLDNNMIGQWALIFRCIKLEVGKSYNIRVFVPQAIKALVLELKVKKKEILKGQKVFVVEAPDIHEKIYVTMDGTLLKIVDERQDLEIVLEESY